MLTLNIVGAGRLGKTIARLLYVKKLCSIKSVCNKRVESAQKAVEFIGSGKVAKTVQTMGKADVTLVTTKDEFIASCANQLTYLDDASLVIHCSGALTSSILPKRSLRASIHPLMSFSTPQLAIKQFGNTYCTYEGNDRGVARALFEKIGGRIIEITQEKKASYHLAATMASNYSYALFDGAYQCFIEAGLDEATSYQLTHSLMQGAIDNVNALKSTQKGLTGPIARADIEVIKNHLSKLHDEKIKALYQALGEYTLRLTTLNDEQKATILAIFKNSV
jgi:predicted short-subunit dehydrogenase-like oxidoreductase (DUF2520 family)